MDKKDVAKVLEEIGLLLELKGENIFKIRAYQNGARTIESLETDIHELVAKDELKNLKGIGKAIEEKVTELVTTGELPYYESLKKEFPEGLFDLFRIQGLGPKKVKILYEELGIETTGELEYACLENRLLDLKGFGKKSQEKILQGIGNLKKYQGQHLISTGLMIYEEILEYLQGDERILRLEAGGSLRRKKEIIKDVDILAAVEEEHREEIAEKFLKFPRVEQIIGKGSTKISVGLDAGINVDLRMVSEEEFPFALHHFTGSKEHNTAMRQRAKERNYKMNEYGIFKGEERLPAKDEKQVFGLLGLPYIAPEMREDLGEIEAAENKELPKLIEGKSISGLLHIHSHYSDGVNSIKEIAEEGIKRKYSYIGISDHSKSAFYAKGLQEERIRKQHEEIENLQEKMEQIRILKGIESDILSDGSLDYEDSVLDSFDYVIASVHGNMKMPKEEMTKRLIRAIEHPQTKILGHWTGRLLLSREGYEFDEAEVFKALKEQRVALEINSNPHRLDLDWRKCRRAKEYGILMTIDPDAHRLSGFDHVVLGVGVARKGWLEEKDVLNTMGYKELMNYWER